MFVTEEVRMVANPLLAYRFVNLSVCLVFLVSLLWNWNFGQYEHLLS